MKKVGFLAKLKREGILELVEPSEEIMQSYLKKSESYLGSAKILLQSDHLEESVSMAYYSMYHLLTALLFITGIKCENHAASIILLTELFGIDNAKIAFAKRERIDKQYYVDFQITKEEALDIIKIAEEFSAELTDFISRLNTEQIQRYRETLEELVGKT